MARKAADTYGLLELAKDVILANRNRPLTAQEIWNKANEEQKNKLITQAKDPVQNIYGMIYQNIRTRDDSDFIGVGRNPVKWQLKNMEADDSADESFDNEDEDENEEKKASFEERDLHKILASYVGLNSYFSTCYCKTIYHEKSTKGGKKKNYWIHPDIVGVSYPFGDTGSYNKRTLGFMKTLEHTECRLYSFEMKINITRTSLRESFFQAVSNSSWAHEGYLVALKYETGIEDEMKMLNESFGIGFIKLDIEDYKNSVRLFSAKRKDELDWNMINRLLQIDNPDFKKFIETIESDMASSSVRNKKDYDETFESDEAFKEYVTKKKIVEI